MSQQRTRDTGPELELRRELSRRGLHYEVHQRPLLRVRREADVLFIRERVAVFVDGCFWHGCPHHRTITRRNARFWQEKIEENWIRDRDTDAQLAASGWTVVRVWEHENPIEATDRVVVAVSHASTAIRDTGIYEASFDCNRRP